MPFGKGPGNFAQALKKVDFVGQFGFFITEYEHISTSA